jgi:serralysin
MKALFKILLSVVVGHALGGAISQIVATELIDWIGEVVTFSSPGTSREIAAKFLQHGGANLTVKHYIINGDIINLVGEAFIAGKVIVQCFSDRTLNPSTT